MNTATLCILAGVTFGAMEAHAWSQNDVHTGAISITGGPAICGLIIWPLTLSIVRDDGNAFGCRAHPCDTDVICSVEVDCCDRPNGNGLTALELAQAFAAGIDADPDCSARAVSDGRGGATLYVEAPVDEDILCCLSSVEFELGAGKGWLLNDSHRSPPDGCILRNVCNDIDGDESAPSNPNFPGFTISKKIDVKQVPALGPLGLAALMALLMGAGAWSLKRRSAAPRAWPEQLG